MDLSLRKIIPMKAKISIKLNNGEAFEITTDSINFTVTETSIWIWDSGDRIRYFRKDVKSFSVHQF
jgi:hypothetical protein